MHEYIFVHKYIFCGYAYVCTFDYVHGWVGLGRRMLVYIYTQKTVCIREWMHLCICLIVCGYTVMCERVSDCDMNE